MVNEITPIESLKGFYFKRDDYFSYNGISGGKVRTALHLIEKSDKAGIVTAGSRFSPQINIVARICEKKGLKFRAHTPKGKLSPELEDAKEHGAKIIQHNFGYNNVIIARARMDALKNDYTEIPFGMECREAVLQTMNQVKNLTKRARRIVVPVGSGMSLAGILHGLIKFNIKKSVIGVVVGANPEKRLNKYAPFYWKSMVELKESKYKYHEKYPRPIFKGIKLDSHYESKTIPFLKKGDLLWIVGIRGTEQKC